MLTAEYYTSMKRNSMLIYMLQHKEIMKTPWQVGKAMRVPPHESSHLGDHREESLAFKIYKGDNSYHKVSC